MSGYDSFCGIYCGGCLCNIAQESGNVEEMARKLNRTVEQLTCTNCKTEQHQDCCFVTCCTANGYNNCSECPEIPCDEVTKFANDGYNHHAIIITNLNRIKDIGLEAWLFEQKADHTCPHCGARTGWSYINCDKCGKELKPNS